MLTGLAQSPSRSVQLDMRLRAPRQGVRHGAPRVERRGEAAFGTIDAGHFAIERAGEAETQPLRGIRISNEVFYLGTLGNTLRGLRQTRGEPPQLFDRLRRFSASQ